MFDQSPDKARGSAFDGDLFGFANQTWGRFAFNNSSTHSSTDPSQSLHHDSRQSFPEASLMDWSPELDPGFSHGGSHGGAVASTNGLELDSLMPNQSGGGVSRLVAQFENKGYAPPLPPRPINNSVSTVDTSPSTSSHFGSLNAAANGQRVTSPITTPGESQYGSLGGGMHSPGTSPMSNNRQAMAFGSYHDAQRIESAGVGSSYTPFGSMDGFMATNRGNSSMVTTPLVPDQMMITPNQPTTLVPGTPGFEIWRPPPSMTIKQETPQLPTSTNFGGYFRPPVPTTPKPVVNTGNQFILEFNPSAAAKAKGKAPAKPPKPPRSRLPPRIAHALSVQAQAKAQALAQATANQSHTPVPAAHTPMSAIVSSPPPALLSPPIKQEPPTPRLLEVTPTPLPVQRQDSIPLRAQAGTRPSREQVPAEAWEQFKGTIRALYLDERRPLKEVMNIMAEKYGFQATPKMYKTRFSQWGFVKNNTEDEVKRLLSMKFQRDAEGKVSEFVRNGRVVNLGTYLKRKGVTEYDLVDFEQPADLPAHIRCRTPTPPPALRSPDLLRAQELVVGNMRKAFLHCRQFEVEMETQVSWPSIMAWGAGSSDLLLEANFFFEARDADQGGHYLMRAFKQLELDLKQLSPQGIMELILGMINRDPGLMTALCKYLAAYSTTNFERSHPLRQIFSCLYEVQQKHGASTLSELLWSSISIIAEELEAIYGRRHPYVARTWVDLALFYNHTNPERLEKLVLELRALQRQLEQRHGPTSAEVVTLRYAIMQLLYSAAPRSEATKQAAMDMWNLGRSMGVVFPVRDSRPNAYCYHSLVKVDPWTKRCRRRYDSGAAIMEEHVGVKVHTYFEEDFHTTEHVSEPQDVWAAALQQMGPSRTWGFI